MNKQKHPLNIHPGCPDRLAKNPMTRQFKSLFGKPKTLTDRYDECRPESIARLLPEPKTELNWNDFNYMKRLI
jgi:hypothetical protein